MPGIGFDLPVAGKGQENPASVPAGHARMFAGENQSAAQCLLA
jgi:hypothetical protein